LIGLFSLRSVRLQAGKRVSDSAFAPVVYVLIRRGEVVMDAKRSAPVALVCLRTVGLVCLVALGVACGGGSDGGAAVGGAGVDGTAGSVVDAPGAASDGGSAGGDTGALSDMAAAKPDAKADGGGQKDTAAFADAPSADTSSPQWDSAWTFDDTGGLAETGEWDSSGGAASDAASDVESDGGGQTWKPAESEVPFASVSLGGGQKLELLHMRITTQIEGLRARTIGDHVYHNPFAKNVEGTFRYPLPPEASVSYFAMYPGDGPADLKAFNPSDPMADLPADQAAEIDPQAYVDAGGQGGWGKANVAKVVKA